jgi:hypothetical protein
MDWHYVSHTVSPALEELKAEHFGAHPDDPIVLHRRELLTGARPFEVLKDPKARAAFNGDLLIVLGQLEYSVITVVIDKQAMLEQYVVWRNNPYHYCMECLLERFARDLNDQGNTGSCQGVRDSWSREITEPNPPCLTGLVR